MKKKVTVIILAIILVPIIGFFVYMELLELKSQRRMLVALFGSETLGYKTISHKDYNRITDREIMIFYEYLLDETTINRFLNEGKGKTYPLYTDYYFNGGRNIQSEHFAQWKPTPPSKEDFSYYQATFGSGTVQSDLTTPRLARDNSYIDEIGNYYTYYSAYPAGIYFYILVPDERKLFFIRHRR